LTQVVGALDENMAPLQSSNGIEVIAFSKLQEEVSSYCINYCFFSLLFLAKDQTDVRCTSKLFWYWINIELIANLVFLCQIIGAKESAAI
jgi:hypothetical protein